MSAQGQVQHNSAICSLPLSEHTGNEACLVWVEKEEKIAEPIAHYTRGPQGNQIPDHYADYVARRSGPPPRGSLGTAGISDRRDNRDPAEVGLAYFTDKASESNGIGRKEVWDEEVRGAGY